MTRFASAREAKEFLVAKIAEEAQREGVPLSEVERKMLYFTETAWTLPDIMEVNEQSVRNLVQRGLEHLRQYSRLAVPILLLPAFSALIF